MRRCCLILLLVWHDSVPLSLSRGWVWSLLSSRVFASSSVILPVLASRDATDRLAVIAWLPRTQPVFSFPIFSTPTTTTTKQRHEQHDTNNNNNDDDDDERPDDYLPQGVHEGHQHIDCGSKRLKTPQVGSKPLKWGSLRRQSGLFPEDSWGQDGQNSERCWHHLCHAPHGIPNCCSHRAVGNNHDGSSDQQDQTT